MAKSSKLHLIKDFINQKIVLYWTDEFDNRVSPLLASMQLAEEWWVKHQFANNSVIERRSSFIDRRKLYVKRVARYDTTRISSKTSEGRRGTDKPIQIHKDLSKVKILQFYADNPELLEIEQQD